MALPVFHVLDRVYNHLQEDEPVRGERRASCGSRHRAHRHEDWRKKLEYIQSQHKKETIEQHRQHLEQLHILQDQLLEEISLNMSVSEHRMESSSLPQGGVALRESRSAELSISQSGVKACLSSPGKVCPTPDRTHQRTEHSLVQSTHVSMESLGSPRPQVRLIRPTQTPQEIWEATNQRTSPQRKLTEAEAHHMSASYRSEYRSSEKSPSPQHGNDGRSHATKSPHVETSPRHEESLVISKVSTTHARSESPSHTSVSHSHTSHCLCQTSTRTTTHNRSSDSVEMLSPCTAKSPARSYNRRQSRQSLLEKHAKHIEDLKKYYGAEIASLSEKLNAMEKLLNQSPPVRRNLDFDELRMPEKCARCGGQHRGREGGGASNAAALAELGTLKAENSRLEDQCGKLQKLVKEKKKQCDELLDQEKQAEGHILEWQDHCMSSEKLITMLKERLESGRKEVQEQDVLKEKLQADLQAVKQDLHAVREDLKMYKLQSKQDKHKMNELFQNFEALQQENLKLREVNNSYEAELKASRTEGAALKASIGNYKVIEARYKGTIHTLEDEVRHLEHIKNRMHSMGTHYQLGYSTTQELTETKHKTQSPAAYPSHKPKHSPPQQPASHTQQPASHTQQQPHPVEQKASSVTPEQSLTKRKWLETSDPSLFGGTPSKHRGREGSQKSSKEPIRHSTPIKEKEKGLDSSAYECEFDSVAQSAIKAVRDGKIVSESSFQHKNVSSKLEMSTGEKTDRTIRFVEVVSDAEHKLDRLLAEKEMLESSLRRAPRAGLRSSREIRQIQFDMEERLEDVMHDIGSARKLLRQHHALGNRK